MIELTKLVFRTPGACLDRLSQYPIPETRRMTQQLAWLFAAALLVIGPSARAQDALQQVRAHHELVIATDPTYAPFENRDSKNNLQGFDIDLGNEIGKELGVKVRWLAMDWAGVQGALATRKCDVSMAGITITEPRKKGSAFSRPYYLSGQEIARRKGDARIRTPHDLIGKTVAVIQETTGQYAVQKLGIPKDSIHRFDTQPDTLLDLQNGKSDAAVGDLPALKAMLRNGYPDVELVCGVGKPENLGVMARHDDLELIAAINQALDNIMVDGRYARIYTRWLQEPVSTALIADLDRVKGDGTPIPPEIAQRVAIKGGDNQSTGQRTSSANGLGIHWSVLVGALPVLAGGAKLTLELTALTLVFGVTLGLVVALVRISGIVPLRTAATFYVEVVRGTPLLMQIYVIYFVLPAFHISVQPFVAGVMALSLNAAAYTSEIFRAGIESIDSGQMEAARSLGMDYTAAMRWVILPQTLRRVLPPLTNEAVALLKDSSLVSVVALNDLMRNGKEIATNNGDPITIYFAVAVFYLVMTLPLTYLVRRLETRWQPISRPRERGAPRATVAATTEAL